MRWALSSHWFVLPGYNYWNGILKETTNPVKLKRQRVELKIGKKVSIWGKILKKMYLLEKK
jgi:hypothetical protein